MGHISSVLRYLLNVSVDFVFRPSAVVPALRADFFYWRHGPQRCLAQLRFGVIPNEHESVDFIARPRFDFGERRNCFKIWIYYCIAQLCNRCTNRIHTFSSRIGNGCTFAVLPVKLPAMERAFNAIAYHSSAYAQMGSQMWAIGIQDASFALFGPKSDQILA